MVIHLYKTSTPRTCNGTVDSQDIYGRIITIEYNPNRNAYICLIHYGDGEKRYILHPRGAIIGDTIISGIEVPLKNGKCPTFECESTLTDMPLGTAIHNIEITLRKGGQLARVTGAVAKLIEKKEKSATLKLPYGEKSLGRAGSKCSLGKCPVVRGVFMNLRLSRGGPWGYLALGRRSITRNKYTDNLILRRRSK
ncbi:hypothetical protein K2173_012277 [Erythroxylum novogranatense]|uniref:Ribosomal protein L2 n=1 Tax=Erythroxylum novogranatense TaxID=1862640 RepID=A0AAV8SBX3_9ROSI|nr:hypothetical protein K2173_012277 [Erythroxylum novogranatense]